jgi:hypothetical protein
MREPCSLLARQVFQLANLIASVSKPIRRANTQKQPQETTLAANCSNRRFKL